MASIRSRSILAFRSWLKNLRRSKCSYAVLPIRLLRTVSPRRCNVGLKLRQGKGYYSSSVSQSQWYGNKRLKVATDRVGMSTPKSSKGPTVSIQGDSIYLYYKAEGSTTLYYAYSSNSDFCEWSDDGDAWVGKYEVTKAAHYLETIDWEPKSTREPAAVGQYIAFKCHDSHGIIQCYSDGRFGFHSAVQVPSAKTDESPAIASFNQQLYIVYKEHQTNSLCFSSRDMGVRGPYSEPERIYCKDGGGYPEASGRPSICVHNNCLYMIFVEKSSKELYYAYCTPDREWFGNKSIKSVSDIDPRVQSDHTVALTTLGNDLYMFYKDGSKNDLCQAILNDVGIWRGNVKIKSISNISPKTDKPPHAATATSDGTIWLLYKGESTNTMYWSYLR